MNSNEMNFPKKKIHRLANKKRKPSGNSINQKRKEKKMKKRKFYETPSQTGIIKFFFIFCVMLRKIYTKY